MLPVLSVAQNNPVLIELFTSQGCSSCPAADENLKNILNEAKKEGRPVYGLSFHVDYWNYLGWKDPYSSKQYTERQRSYSSSLGLEGIYTPQMVVNGEYEFVGSNRKAADQAIARARSEKFTHQLEITKMKVVDRQLQIEYKASRAFPEETLNMALVEREVKNYVSRGENAGRNSQHVQVVRFFDTLPLKLQSDISVPLPDHTSPLSVVLFVSGANKKVSGIIYRDLQ